MTDQTTASAEALTAAEPIIPALPVKLGEGGLEVIAWEEFLPAKADLPNTAALIQYEVEAITGRGEVHDLVRAERVSRASGTILDRVESGHLVTMGDVACMIDFVADNNPSVKRVGELFDEGHSMTDVAQIYEARETMNVSLGSVVELAKEFNFELDDEQSVDLMCEAVDRVIEYEHLDPRFRDIAAHRLIQMVRGGLTLRDILEL